MKFEKAPKPESAPQISAVKQIEEGNLQPEHIQELHALKSRALRYGVFLWFGDKDIVTRQPMDVVANLENMRKNLEQYERRIQFVANHLALEALSPDEQVEYRHLKSLTPEEREEEGEGWRNPEDLLHAEDVRTMDDEMLEEVLEAYDLQNAIIKTTNQVDDENLGEVRGLDPERVDEQMEEMSEWIQNYKLGRKLSRQALALQMDRPGLILHDYGITATEYLELVKKKLEIK